MSGDEGVGEIPGPPELPGDPSSDYGARVEAAFLGALAGEHAAQAPAAAGDLLEVANSIATVGGFDADDLRRRGLVGSSQAGPAGLLLRAVPFALLAPLDRPRIRRDAYRVAALAGADEGTAIAAMAAALLAADLTRFDPATAVVRVYQSLLEDAPFALLERLRPGEGPPPRRPTTTPEPPSSWQWQPCSAPGRSPPPSRPPSHPAGGRPSAWPARWRVPTWGAPASTLPGGPPFRMPSGP